MKNIKYNLNKERSINIDSKENTITSLDISEKSFSNLCSFCYDKITNAAKLECRHQFCLKELKTYISNGDDKCPICRQQFRKYWYKDQCVFINKTITRIKKKQEEEWRLQNDNYVYEEICSECKKSGGKVLVCDRCNGNNGYIAHIKCAGFEKEETPEEDWYCLYCRDLINLLPN